jgi:hypothetical protein
MNDKERGAYLSSLESLSDSNNYKLALDELHYLLLKEDMGEDGRIEYVRIEAMVHKYEVSQDDEYMESLEEAEEEEFEPLEREEYILYKPEGNIEDVVKPITSEDERHLVNKWRGYYLFVRQNCDPFSEDREEADKYLRILEDLDDGYNAMLNERENRFLSLDMITDDRDYNNVKAHIEYLMKFPTSDRTDRKLKALIRLEVAWAKELR